MLGCYRADWRSAVAEETVGLRRSPFDPAAGSPDRFEAAVHPNATALMRHSVSVAQIPLPEFAVETSPFARVRS